MLALPFVFKKSGWIGGTFVTLSFSSVGKAKYNERISISHIILIMSLVTFLFYVCVTAWRTTIILGRELNGDPRPVSLFSDDVADAQNVRMRKSISSFPDIARESFGQSVNIFLSSILYFELFSCLCIFLVSIGDHLRMLIPSVSMNVHMITVAALLIIPTALLRTPKLLSYLSVRFSVHETVCI